MYSSEAEAAAEARIEDHAAEGLGDSGAADDGLDVVTTRDDLH
jgi:hypothetical protein